MADRPLTISGLLDKRAELVGQIRSTRKTLYDLSADLEHLDHVIRLFDPDGEVPLRKPRRESSKLPAFKGEMQRHVLDALRDADKPLTSLDLATYVVTVRGLDASDRRIVVLVRKRITACLTKLRKRGLVQEVPQLGAYKGWQLLTDQL